MPVKRPTKEAQIRVRELREVRAGDLVPNPKNWRMHPTAQKRALSAVVSEIGIADVLLARETDDGKLMLIDGHMRQSMDPEQIWPVAILDLSEEEADKLLLTLDPIAGLAKTDEGAVANLLAGMQASNEAFADLVDSLHEKPEKLRSLDPSPKLGDVEFRVVVDCKNEADQAELMARFEKEGLVCRPLMS